MLNLWIFIGLMMACAVPEPSKRTRLTGSSVTNAPNPMPIDRLPDAGDERT